MLIAGFGGCGSSSSSSSGGSTSMDALASQADAQSAAKKQEDAAVVAKAAADQKAAAAAAQAAQNPPAPDRKAVGSRTIVQGGGYYSAIMGARRHVMNVADAIAWIQGVRSFKAEEGRKPKNTDEFMKVVVPKYDLQLPRIEADEEFLYDPNGESDGDFGQLYVVKKPSPADAADPSGPTPGAPAPGTPAPSTPSPAK
jgi:hypothetical protein